MSAVGSNGGNYLARARTYVTMLEQTMDAYFNAHFLDPASLMIRRPSDPAYGRQNVNAWNRMMFFANAFQTLGQIHHLLGDEAAKDTMYRSVVENTVEIQGDLRDRIRAVLEKKGWTVKG